MNKYKITIDGNAYDVSVNVTDHNKANVEVNGISYDVTYENKTTTTVSPVTRKVAAPAAPQVQVQQPTASASKNSVKSPLPGTISAINVKVGAQVKRGDTLIVMEAMKMENNIMASSDGQVKAIHVTVGQTVAQDDPLIYLA